MQDANNIDLSQFRRWYSQAGTPKVTVKTDYNDSENGFSLTLSQSYPNQQAPLLIPIKIGLLDAKTGVDLLPPTLLQFNQMQQVFHFEGISEAPILSILREFSAPVIIEYPRSLEELAFLSQHDSDSFNRWDASQQLVQRIILDLVAKNDAVQAHGNNILVETFEKFLTQPIDDLAYFSLLLALPSETYLAECMTTVDFEGIHLAREQVMKTVVNTFSAQFEAIYHANHKDESGDFSAAAIGRRRVKNACLAFLGKLNAAQYHIIAHEQFKHAKNMTDQIAALAVIVKNNHPEKNACLAQFYAQWENEALVIDKWFALQASSPQADAFETI
ncbi:MAG: aminopeptidase, partial [Pseudomonadota bacterium]|nr:aminopeptidase [Pseudomonadota bacterium]